MAHVAMGTADTNMNTTPTEPTEPTATVAFDPGTFERLHRAYRRIDRSDPAQAWHLLEALHVLGQTRLVSHARTHGLMLALAWRTIAVSAGRSGNSSVTEPAASSQTSRVLSLRRAARSAGSIGS